MSARHLIGMETDDMPLAAVSAPCMVKPSDVSDLAFVPGFVRLCHCTSCSCLQGRLCLSCHYLAVETGRCMDQWEWKVLCRFAPSEPRAVQDDSMFNSFSSSVLHAAMHAVSRKFVRTSRTLRSLVWSRHVHTILRFSLAHAIIIHMLALSASRNGSSEAAYPPFCCHSKACAANCAKPPSAAGMQQLL